MMGDQAEVGGRRRRGLLLAAGVAVLGLVAAACGGGTSDSQGTGSASAATDAAEAGEGELTLVMDDFTFLPETMTVSAGEDVELTIVNEGAVPHELMIGLPVGGGPEWEADLFGRMEPEIMHGDGYHTEGFEHMDGAMEEAEEEEHGMGHGAEVEVDPGGQVTIRMHIPEDAAGEWELGCFLPQHYEAGMKGTLIVA